MTTKQAKGDAPQVEERPFSEAELETLTKKYAKLNEATAEVNEFLDFLKKQHGIEKGEGWQLGQRGFVRETAPPPPTATPDATGAAAAKPTTRKRATRPKAAAAAE